MGINFYWDVAKRGWNFDEEQEEMVHIGKSSAGWYFSLHIHPALNINNWDDWKKNLVEEDIFDEFGDMFTLKYLVNIVENRVGSDSIFSTNQDARLVRCPKYNLLCLPKDQNNGGPYSYSIHDFS